jgi:hypothetical protein
MPTYLSIVTHGLPIVTKTLTYTTMGCGSVAMLRAVTQYFILPHGHKYSKMGKRNSVKHPQVDTTTTVSTKVVLPEQTHKLPQLSIYLVYHCTCELIFGNSCNLI